ncbi:hypothetical protein Tco_1056632 [Tanacetum coccineum]|uniref:Uncharacterized protein n=1 Tax=Tanacetum coccineum TaxID=301880 RepID=A0ABQ5H4K4_9ASTR
MKVVFNQMETEVEQCSVDRKCVEIEKKELLIENDRLLEKIIFRILCVMQCMLMLKINDAPEFLAFFEINDLKAQLQAKNTSINKLKEHIATLKGKSVYDCTIPINNLNVIGLEMYKLDWQPLSPKLRKNREACVDYLKKTMEHADTLRDILEQARALKPLDNALDYACKFSTRIHELLVYVSATRPSSRNDSEKSVSVMPVNKKNQVMFEEPSTSTSNIQKQVVTDVLWYWTGFLHSTMTRQRFSAHPSLSGILCSALMQNLSSSTPYVPPTKKDLDILFQPMFDEYFQPFSSVVSCVLPNVALIPSDPTGTPSSTTLDQDAPYASTSLTTHETQSLVIHPGVEE